MAGVYVNPAMRVLGHGRGFGPGRGIVVAGKATRRGRIPVNVEERQRCQPRRGPARHEESTVTERALCSRMLHFIVATAGMLAIGWLVFRLLQRQERQSGNDRPKGT